MARLSNDEVQAQKQRFEQMMETCDLVKAGRIYVSTIIDKYHNGFYREFVYRYFHLWRISGSMIHPDIDRFYADIFSETILNAYVESLKNK